VSAMTNAARAVMRAAEVEAVSGASVMSRDPSFRGFLEHRA
jgi:hypothetical protein